MTHQLSRDFAVALAVSVAVLPVAMATPGSSAGERVVLLPHRAVYDLRLDTTREAKGIDGARSRIAFDFSGDACEGYVLSFRQVTAIEPSEGPRRIIDTRTTSHEMGDGGLFTFTNENQIQGGPKEASDGAATRQGDGYSVKLLKPAPARFELAGDVLFPTAQLKAVIQAARAGEATLNVPLFDGAEDGQQVYDTLTVIGKRIDPVPTDRLEAGLTGPAFANVPRWPVTTSYFKRKSDDITPAYKVAFELFDNGVTRALKLDYNDFILAGDLTSFELLPAKACSR